MLEEYHPPEFAAPIAAKAPKQRVRLATSNTRIHRLRLSGATAAAAAAVWVKRDDETGSVMSGNKVRKLEFLMADALVRGCDSVVTIGGMQSNHARAVAVAAREVGLEPYLLLRWSGPQSELAAQQTSLIGNLLIDRLVGAHVRLFTPAQRDARGGNDALLQQWADELASAGRKPYVIPMGGSNSVGSWGYIECAAEIAQQCRASKLDIDDIVVAAGSGGTLAGLGVGIRLAMGPGVRVHGVCVCDNAQYFYDAADAILRDMGAPWQSSRDIVDVIEGYVGMGYAQSTDEELRQQAEIAMNTGVVFDPVYSGKALRAVLEDPRFRNRRVLLIHTGGMLGCFEKAPQFARLLPPMDILH